jgi:hypothetical protein
LTKGFCPVQGTWIIPVRTAWGLDKNQRLSPSLQRKLCYTAAETGSFEKASALVAQWGCSISDDAIRSCTLRCGQKGIEQPLSTPCPERAGKDDVLIIMMDGWMARHRGKGWGFKNLVEGYDRVNWHEIKSAVIFRLKDQASLSPKRGALISKHVVATPAQTDPITFGQRVHHEACRMGLAQAKKVYVVMDGATWLWNVFEDRFSSLATGTLDFYHASEHLHALGNELFGQSTDESRNWCQELLHTLKHSSSDNLFATLADLIARPPNTEPETIEAIRQARAYFEKHKEHMNYAGADAQGLPLGSGSMESQCSQFQGRFKRCGQFWTKNGFATLLEVAVRQQNGELRSLWAA